MFFNKFFIFLKIQVLFFQETKKLRKSATGTQFQSFMKSGRIFVFYGFLAKSAKNTILVKTDLTSNCSGNVILWPILVILPIFERANHKFSFFGKIFGFHVKFAKNGPFNCENPFWANMAYFGTFVLQTAITLAKIYVFQQFFQKMKIYGLLFQKMEKLLKSAKGSHFQSNLKSGWNFVF